MIWRRAKHTLQCATAVAGINVSNGLAYTSLWVQTSLLLAEALDTLCRSHAGWFSDLRTSI